MAEPNNASAQLVMHPASNSRAIEAITASIAVTAAAISVGFRIVGAIEELVIPDTADPMREDGLWRTTCCELYVQNKAGSEYFEFNLSPTSCWAAYRFDAYREGRSDLTIPSPIIRTARTRDCLSLAATLFPHGLICGPVRVGLATIVEERSGILGYWALAHADGEEDFHRTECFALSLG